MLANSSLNTSRTSMPAGWQKAGFPVTIQDMKQSLRFVKRLIAIGFSQILYLRTDLSDDCFKTHLVGDIDLRMLKANSSSEAANKLTVGLKNAMDALELGYLRQLVIVIMEDKNKPEEAYETYTFNFNKPNNSGHDSGSPGFSLVQTARKCNKPNNDQGRMEGTVSKNIVESENLIGNDPGNQSVNGDTDQHKIYNATKKLLTKLIFAMQGLNDLPEQAYMTVQIGYFDESTPQGYEPRGFRSTENGACFVDNGVSPVKIGQVKSQFHQVMMSYASKASHDSGGVDQNMPTGQQLEGEIPVKHNASFIPLNTGLDVSAMDQSRQENASILSHGSNVENCDSEISEEVQLANENVLKNIQKEKADANSKGKGKGKKSKRDSEILPETNRPTAYGDNQIVFPVNENAEKMKQLDAGNNCLEDDHSANTSRSSLVSVRSQRSLRPVRKVSSVRDTFSDDVYYGKDFQPKASFAKNVIRI